MEKIEKKTYDEFIKQDNYKELEYLEENKLEKEVNDILEELTKIQQSNKHNIFSFNFKSYVRKC